MNKFSIEEFHNKSVCGLDVGGEIVELAAWDHNAAKNLLALGQDDTAAWDHNAAKNLLALGQAAQEEE